MSGKLSPRENRRSKMIDSSFVPPSVGVESEHTRSPSLRVKAAGEQVRRKSARASNRRLISAKAQEMNRHAAGLGRELCQPTSKSPRLSFIKPAENIVQKEDQPESHFRQVALDKKLWHQDGADAFDHRNKRAKLRGEAFSSSPRPYYRHGFQKPHGHITVPSRRVNDTTAKSANGQQSENCVRSSVVSVTVSQSATPSQVRPKVCCRRITSPPAFAPPPASASSGRLFHKRLAYIATSFRCRELITFR